MKVFHHNDADGRCAGFWVKNSALVTDPYPVEFIEINYGTPFPFDTINPDETVWIVDYSIDPEEMLRLLSITKDVVWIDHHKTAIDKYKNFPHYIPGVRYDGIAACMLTYLYLIDTIEGAPDNAIIDQTKIEDAPLFTQLIADWDVWKFDFGQMTKEFVTALNAHDMHPGSTVWLDLLYYPTAIVSLSAKGRAMIAYRDGWAKDYCKAKGFEVLVGGVPAFAMNLGNCNSDFFKSISDKYDIFVPFSFDGNQWSVSLYSEIIDCGSVAKHYGGGGHKGAAGFTTREFPFIKSHTLRYGEMWSL